MQSVNPTWARMAAWAVVARPSLHPRSVAWLAPGVADRVRIARLEDTAGARWAVRLTDRDPTPGDRFAAALPSDVPGAPPVARGAVTLADGRVVTVTRWAPGRPLRWVTVRPGDPVVAQFGELLATVHGADAAELVTGPVPGAEELRSQRLEQLDAAAGTGLVPSRLLARWEAMLEDEDLWCAEPTLVHGALQGDHVLVSDAHALSAVFGWGSVRVGDPAEDFAHLAGAATPDVLAGVRSSYEESLGRPDERLLERAQALLELQEMTALVEADAAGDREGLREARAALAHRDRMLAEAEELDTWE
ncbi:Phosphotransferase enzyme family protein [Kytococcus aerolatus]|uniref:Phosphotransferase enzyme family protein n=1 Tax=Kytococcus aerolatus TaxID=592308 RepID=A0A212T7H2_9MICO|nr:Phosphotransferase enzyme family protein [Kytococcus aerolatus]